jgi:NADH-quinone oxidoreductase subunit N
MPLFEIFDLRKVIIPIIIIGLLAILGLDISEFNSPAAYYNNMIIVSKFSTAFSGLFIILTIFLVALSHKFYEHHQTKISDFIAIKKYFIGRNGRHGFFWKLSYVLLGIVLSIAHTFWRQATD